jgi:hypothetical protein
MRLALVADPDAKPVKGKRVATVAPEVEPIDEFEENYDAFYEQPVEEIAEAYDKALREYEDAYQQDAKEYEDAFDDVAW